MARPGQNIGNRHAAKKPGEQKRVTLTVSLSGKRRQFFDRFTKTENGTPPTEEEIIKEARKMFYQTVDDAIRQVTQKEQGK